MGIKQQLQDVKKHAKSYYSQHGEDGITQWVFERIGINTQKFLDIGAGNGRESNIAMLAYAYRWNGLAIEADLKNVNDALDYFKKLLGDAYKRVNVIHTKVTTDNVNRVVSNAGLSGEIDFLTLDIDGNDYWIWDALEVVEPRVVLAEYNTSFGLHPITIPYNPDFHMNDYDHKPQLYYGAGLAALNEVAHRKGYILAGAEMSGVNAYFIKKEAAAGIFEDVPVEQAFKPSGARATHGSWQKQFEMVSSHGLKFIDVTLPVGVI